MTTEAMVESWAQETDDEEMVKWFYINEESGNYAVQHSKLRVFLIHVPHALSHSVRNLSM